MGCVKKPAPLSMRLGEPHGRPGRVNILFLETFGPDMKFVFHLLRVCQGSFLLNKFAGNKIGQSQLSRAEEKNGRCHSSTPPYFFMACTLICVCCLTIIIIININIIIINTIVTAVISYYCAACCIFSFAAFARRCFVKHIYSKDRKPCSDIFKSSTVLAKVAQRRRPYSHPRATFENEIAVLRLAMSVNVMHVATNFGSLLQTYIIYCRRTD